MTRAEVHRDGALAIVDCITFDRNFASRDVHKNVKRATKIELQKGGRATLRA